MCSVYVFAYVLYPCSNRPVHKGCYAERRAIRAMPCEHQPRHPRTPLHARTPSGARHAKRTLRRLHIEHTRRLPVDMFRQYTMRDE